MIELLPVTDGDHGADIYGYATTIEEARELAERVFVDPIHHVECYGPINCSDGKTLTKAFVVFTVFGVDRLSVLDRTAL